MANNSIDVQRNIPSDTDSVTNYNFDGCDDDDSSEIQFNKL